jgi:hypothetical protein
MDYREQRRLVDEFIDGFVMSYDLVVITATDADIPGRGVHCYWVGEVDTDDATYHCLVSNKDRALKFPVYGTECLQANYAQIVKNIEEYNPEITVHSYSVVNMIKYHVFHSKEWSYES